MKVNAFFIFNFEWNEKTNGRYKDHLDPVQFISVIVMCVNKAFHENKYCKGPTTINKFVAIALKYPAVWPSNI